MLLPAAFSLNRALQINLPAYVAAIEEVSEYASKVGSDHKGMVLTDDSWSIQ